jgi:hypothetical protein
MLVFRQGKLKASLTSNYQSILVIVILSLFTVSCEENKSSQCEQIFRVVRDVQQNNQNASDGNEQSSEMKNWLQAANRFNQAADHMTVLKINHSELIRYQNQLITIYRIYSQATYDAVTARENKDVLALKSARQDAIKAGIIQQKLIQEINTYCLNKQNNQ